MRHQQFHWLQDSKKKKKEKHLTVRKKKSNMFFTKKTKGTQLSPFGFWLIIRFNWCWRCKWLKNGTRGIAVLFFSWSFFSVNTHSLLLSKKKKPFVIQHYLHLSNFFLFKFGKTKKLIKEGKRKWCTIFLFHTIWNAQPSKKLI